MLLCWGGGGGVKQVGAVVVGLDTSFGFRQMCVASSYIQRGALFLGTNPDVADRVGSLLMPGTGPILASIQTASGVRETVSTFQNLPNLVPERRGGNMYPIPSLQYVCVTRKNRIDVQERTSCHRAPLFVEPAGALRSTTTGCLPLLECTPYWPTTTAGEQR